MVDSEVKNVFPVTKIQKIPVKTESRMHNNLGFPPIDDCIQSDRCRCKICDGQLVNAADFSPNISVFP
jgi:hypothetical protein